MLLSTDTLIIKQGDVELKFTIDEFQKMLVRENRIFAEFVEVSRLYKEKLKQKEEYNSYIENCDQIIGFLDDHVVGGI